MPKEIPDRIAYASNLLVQKLNEKVERLERELNELKIMVDVLFDKSIPSLDQTEPRLELELSPTDNQMVILKY